MKILLSISLLLMSVANATIYTTQIWDKKEILVCYNNQPSQDEVVTKMKYKIKNWKSKDKETLKSWVNQEYSENKTGIHFIGWQNCEDTVNPDLILYRVKNSQILTTIFGGLNGLSRQIALSGLGQSNDKIANYPTARSAIAFSDTGIKKYTIIHEFGHIAGLAHEHANLSSSLNTCTMPNSEYEYEYGLLSYSGFEITEYDANSIMSYCNKDRSNLSEVEANVLRDLYSKVN